MTTTADTPLFRAEAMARQLPDTAGEILLSPAPSTRWIAWGAAALALAIVAFLVLGSYTRRATAAGLLVPRDGLIRVASPITGVVTQRLVAEGEGVASGQPLLEVSAERIGGAQGRSVQGDLAEQMQRRDALLADEQQRAEGTRAREIEQLNRRIALLHAERPELDRQIQAQRQRAGLANEARERYRRLREQEIVTRDELLAREADAAEQAGRLAALGRDREALDREVQAARREITALTQRYDAARADNARSRLVLAQERTELDAQRRLVVTAPSAGRVSWLQAEPGQDVDPTRTLVHLVPADARLVARLYVPSRAIGFVRPGMRVRLRYDAYPYQKFGQHEARVASVSRAAVPPAEIAGLGSNVDPTGASVPGEPLFAVDVELPSPALGEGPGAQPLQAGMRLEADLMQETRRLYEWVLEPLYAARERLGG